MRPIRQVDDGHSYPDVSDVIRVTLTPHDSMDDGESMTEESTDNGS